MATIKTVNTYIGMGNDESFTSCTRALATKVATSSRSHSEDGGLEFKSRAGIKYLRAIITSSISRLLSTNL